MRHRYIPIDEKALEIRYLVLLPGTFADPLRGLLVNAPLQNVIGGESLSYEALSYAWGSYDDPLEITLMTANVTDIISRGIDSEAESSASCPGQVTITRNLGRALPYLRRTDRSRLIWVDSICVNQEDLEERSAQVQRMAAIFKQATQVVVWLGEGDPESHIALDFLKMINTKVRSDWDSGSLDLISIDPDDVHWSDRMQPVYLDKEIFYQLYAIFRSPWFYRLWVWQEIHLANDAAMLLYGRNWIYWQEFCNAVLVISIKDYVPDKFAAVTGEVLGKFRHQHLFVWNMMQPIYNRDWGFAGLSELTQNSKCSDPRDRVYALLSLISSNELSIRPDYTKSIESIFKQATEIVFHNTQCLNLLVRCEMPERNAQQLRLPSWVPDLSATKGSKWARFHRYSFSTLDEVETHDNVLNVKGIEIAVIDTITKATISATMAVEDVATELARVTSCLSVNAEYRTGESMWEAVARTFCADTFAERWPGFDANLPSESQIQACYTVMTAILAQKTPVLSGALRTFLAGTRRYLRGRDFFTTREGYMGLCPVSAQRGDFVTSVVGCSSPLIMRRQMTGQFQIVGEAYCHGIMYGEPFSGPLPVDIVFVRSLLAGYPGFRNRYTGQLYVEDPRHDSLPPGWQRVPHENSEKYSIFCNETTGKRYKSFEHDPRTLPTMIESRAVKLQTFHII